MNTCTDHISIETIHDRGQLYPSAITDNFTIHNYLKMAISLSDSVKLKLNISTVERF